MPKQLRLEEMLDCLRILGEDELVANMSGILEAVGSIMARRLARKLGVVSRPAVCEESEFEGCCAPFMPTFHGQPCPYPLSEFDKGGEWGFD